MKITTSELLVLKSLITGNFRMNDLRNDLDLSSSRVSSLVSNLVEKGFITKYSNGNSKYVSFSDQSFIQDLKYLLSSHIQHERIFCRSSLPFLLTLVIQEMSTLVFNEEVTGFSMKQIQHFSGLSKDTVFRTLKDLNQAVVLQRVATRIRISPTQKELRQFLMNYSQYLVSIELNRIAQAARIPSNELIVQYLSGTEFIFSVPRGSEIPTSSILSPTSITMFEEEGLLFLRSHDYFHYHGSGRRVRREDHAIDCILLNPFFTRNKSYAMLYILKFIHEIDFRYLRELGEIFGIAQLVKNIINYVEHFPSIEHDIPPGFPSVAEFQQLCVQYEVEYNAE